MDSIFDIQATNTLRSCCEPRAARTLCSSVANASELQILKFELGGIIKSGHEA
jgi:hypothetical protein